MSLRMVVTTAPNRFGPRDRFTCKANAHTIFPYRTRLALGVQAFDERREGEVVWAS